MILTVFHKEWKGYPQSFEIRSRKLFLTLGDMSHLRVLSIKCLILSLKEFSLLANLNASCHEEVSVSNPSLHARSRERGVYQSRRSVIRGRYASPTFSILQ